MMTTFDPAIFAPKALARMHTNKVDTLLDIFHETFTRYPNHVAYINYGVSVTYADIDKYSQQFANYLLHELKLAKGSHIAIMMPNVLQYPIAMIGALRAGMVVVNFNPLMSAHDLKILLKDAEIAAMVVFANSAHAVEQVLPEFNIKHVIVTPLGEMLGALKGAVVNFVVKYVKHLLPKYSIPHAISFKQALSLGRQHTFVKQTVKADDLAFLQYTGGTTGVPKGVMLLHRNMVANALQGVELFCDMLTYGEEKMLGALPLYHIYSLTLSLICFTFGITLVLITDPRDLPSFIGFLKKTPVTVFIGLNTLFNGLLKQEKFRKLNFKKLKLVIAGGMATQNDVAKRWQQVTGIHISQGYGLSEASPVVTMSPMTDTEFLGSIGKAFPATELSVRDEQGHEVGIGHVGELWVKGPQVMLGYWKNEAATREVLRDDWLLTGDMVRIDEQGYVFLVDRKKDLIIVSGFNVYPSEVEDVIMEMPEVSEVGVVGLSNGDGNEQVVAAVVRETQALNVEDVMKYCQQQLTAYKVPKRIVFVDELPKTNVGKVLRRELRERLSV